MSVVLKIAAYQLRDLARSRWLLAYAGFFLLATEALLRFGDGGPKTLLGLANVVVFIVPLVSIVFGTVYLYNARDHIEMLLAQPVGRSRIFAGLWIGLGVSLCGALVAGMAIPLAVHGMAPRSQAALATVVVTGVALTLTFVSLAFVLVGLYDDRLKGLGAAIGLWMLAGLVYDGVVLYVSTAFADKPLERVLLAMSIANPVDLGRIAVLLQLDASALMGYTGAVFHHFFASGSGLATAALALSAWIALPYLIGARLFRTKDF
jgi:Cu-processing system permease protein